MAIRIERPTTVREALALKKKGASAYLGGGTWLGSGAAGVGGGAAPASLISLEHLGLSGISREGALCRIGAAATLQAIMDDACLPPALREAAGLTASRTLRNMATLGGEAALAQPDSAILAVLTALHARIVTSQKKAGFDAAAWCTGPRAADDLILEVVIPDAGLPCVVHAVSRGSAGARSLVMAVSARKRGGKLESVCIAASDCVGPMTRLRAAEDALEGRSLPPRERIEGMVKGSWSPKADIHASSEYKRYIAGVTAADLLHRIGGAE